MAVLNFIFNPKLFQNMYCVQTFHVTYNGSIWNSRVTQFFRTILFCRRPSFAVVNKTRTLSRNCAASEIEDWIELLAWVKAIHPN